MQHGHVVVYASRQLRTHVEHYPTPDFGISRCGAMLLRFEGTTLWKRDVNSIQIIRV
jgi:hypothetical protein